MTTNTQISPLKLLTLGYSVIPSGAGDKGKSPLVDWTKYQEVMPTEDNLEKWKSDFLPSLWGIVTGAISDIVIVDVDKPDEYKIFETQGIKPHIKTPRGGFHYYFKYPGFAVKSRVGVMPGLDIRADGGFANVTGSNPVTGGSYEVLIIPTRENVYPWDKIPAPILKAILTTTRIKKAAATAMIPHGERNATLASIAGQLRHVGATQEEIETRLLRDNRERCDPPLSENEVLTIANSIARYEPAPIGGNGHKHADNLIETVNFTDAENGEYITALYSDTLRYDHRRARWLEWHNHYWRTDSDGQVTRLALKAARARWQATVNITDNELRQKATKKAIESEQRARLDNALALAHDFQPIADSGDNWDKNPWLFAVANGVIDLKTGKLRPGKQSDMITMRSPVQYSPAAKAPRWTQFLNEIFDNNNELISWLQRYMGYCLTGSIKEQIIPIGYGNGANGKTVFIVVIRYVIGEYAYDAPFNTFELNNRNPIPNDLAALGGKRFVTSSETNEGSRFNEARIKSLTGGDSVTARFLHCEYFTYQPVAKFFLAVNHRPRVSDDSYGFWRRVRLIPFTRQFKGSADDKELTSKLIDEAPGILAWLVQGCLKWQNEGMESTPECIITATKEYESESDPLSGFILDECVISEQVHVQSSRLYKAYKDWCHGQGMQDKEILTLNAFGRRMGKNYKKSHKEGGAIYLSLALKADGFLTDSKAMFTGNTLNPHIDTRVENECENPSDSVIPSADNDLPPYPDKPCPVCDSECYRLDENNEYVCDDCRPLKKR